MRHLRYDSRQRLASKALIFWVYALLTVSSSDAKNFAAPTSCVQSSTETPASLSDLNLYRKIAHTVSIAPIPAQISTQGCETYPGNQQELAKEFLASLESGLACLSQSPSRSSRSEAATLLKFLSSPNQKLNLFCTRKGSPLKIGNTDYTLGPLVNARTLISPEEGAPGILLNIDALSAGSLESRKGTYFHESLHLIGLRHGLDFDTPYLAGICCSPGSTLLEYEEAACALLHAEPRPEKSSKEYVGPFTRLMIQTGYAAIAKTTVENLIVEATKEKKVSLFLAALEGSIEMNRLGFRSSFFFIDLIARLSPDARRTIPNPIPRSFAPEDENAYRSLAKSVSIVLKGNPVVKEYVDSLKETKANLKIRLSKITSDEERKLARESFTQIIEAFEMNVYNIPQPDPKTYFSFISEWKKLKEL
jgi:hypothetical protein